MNGRGRQRLFTVLVVLLAITGPISTVGVAAGVGGSSTPAASASVHPTPDTPGAESVFTLATDVPAESRTSADGASANDLERSAHSAKLGSGAAVDPDPSMQVDVPSTVEVGEPLTVSVDATNRGGDAGPYSTITVSSPDFDTYGADVFDVISADGDYEATRAAGDTIWTKAGEQTTAEYALAETGIDGDGTWASGDSRQLTAEVVPDEPGTVDIYVRTTLTDGDASHTAPRYGDRIDQQGYEVERHTVEVVDDEEPEPSMSVDLPDAVEVGEPIEVAVEATNRGGDAGPYSTITVSSPDFDTYGADAFDVTTADGDYGATRAAGDTIWTRDGEQLTAEYALAETGIDGDGTWASGDSRRLTAEVVPEESGTVDIYVRTTLTDGNGASYTAPRYGDRIDQQGYAVERYSVDVTEAEDEFETEDPEPAMSVDVPDAVEVGEPIEVAVDAINRGGDAGPHSTITVSSPDFDTYGADAFDVVAADGDYEATRAAGDTIWTRDEEGTTAEYALAETGIDGDGTWTGGDDRYLIAEVVPDEPGTVDIYVRTTLTDGNGASYTAPRYGDRIDQQGYAVERYTVEVETAADGGESIDIRDVVADESTYDRGERAEIDVTVENPYAERRDLLLEYSIDGPNETVDGERTIRAGPDGTETERLEWIVHETAGDGPYDVSVSVLDLDDPESTAVTETADAAFEVESRPDATLSWNDSPPRQLPRTEPVRATVEGVAPSDGEICLVLGDGTPRGVDLECEAVSAGSINRSFAVAAADLPLDPGDSSTLSVRFTPTDGDQALAQTDSVSVDVEERDGLAVTVTTSDGEPIANATVTLHGVGERTTDDRGTVVFPDDLESETHLVVDDGSEYSPEVRTVGPDADSVTVDISGAERVTGTIYDADGVPVTRTEVSIPGTAVETTTDGAGRFAFDEPVPVGEYDLTVAGYDDVTIAVEPGTDTYEIRVEPTTEDDGGLVDAQKTTFVKGAACGDPCWNGALYDEDHSMMFLSGWIGASVLPVSGQFADARDFGSALARGDGTDAALAALGIASGPAAVPKAASKIRKFLGKYPGKQTAVAKLVLESRVIPNDVLYRAVYPDAPDSLRQVDNDILVRHLDGDGIDPIVRHLNQDVDPQVVNRLADEGADLTELRVGDQVAESDIERVARRGDLSEAALIENRGGRTVWLESGDANSGFKHISQRHAKDFRKADLGVSTDEDVLRVVRRTITDGEPHTIPESAGGGTAYIRNVNGDDVTVIVSENGYVVTSYPGVPNNLGS